MSQKSSFNADFECYCNANKDPFLKRQSEEKVDRND